MKLFSHEKLFCASFLFVPKLSDVAVIITEDSDYDTHHWKNKLFD